MNGTQVLRYQFVVLNAPSSTALFISCRVLMISPSDIRTRLPSSAAPCRRCASGRARACPAGIAAPSFLLGGGDLLIGGAGSDRVRDVAVVGFEPRRRAGRLRLPSRREYQLQVAICASVRRRRTSARKTSCRHRRRGRTAARCRCSRLSAGSRCRLRGQAALDADATAARVFRSVANRANLAGVGDERCPGPPAASQVPPRIENQLDAPVLLELQLPRDSFHW